MVIVFDFHPLLPSFTFMADHTILLADKCFGADFSAPAPAAHAFLAPSDRFAGVHSRRITFWNGCHG